MLELRLSRHRLPLARPLRLGQKMVHERELLLLRMSDGRGHTGLGEIAPLPGFSVESLEQAELHAVRQAHRILAGADETADDTPASVRFGFGMARAWLRARQASLPLHDALGAREQIVQLSGLLAGSPSENLRKAEELSSAGYRSLKLKVAVSKPAEEKALIRGIREVVGPDVELRLDANRGWSFAEATGFADVVLAAGVSHVEEPLRDSSRLGELARDTGMPIALDESMRGATDVREAGLAVAKAGIIKPTLTGFGESIELGLDLARRGVRPVLSAAFESGVGLCALLALAACEPFAGTPAGLDTYGWIAQDVMQPRLPLPAPSIDLRSIEAAGSAPELSAGDEVPL